MDTLNGNHPKTSEHYSIHIRPNAFRMLFHIIESKREAASKLTYYSNNPLKRMAMMRKEVNRLFNNFPFDFNFPHKLMTRFHDMKVELQETDTEIIASFKIPSSIKEDEVFVTVEHNILTIQGTTDSMTEVKQENRYQKEHNTFVFQRSISLPYPVSTENMKMTIQNERLEIKMQKQM